jgi:pantoate--beta-alanine ligase
MKIATTRGELAETRAALIGASAATRPPAYPHRADPSCRVAVVMTMGALHEGHAMLLREARKNADHVIATIFVNPLQFGPAEDFQRYPRTLDADLDTCRAEGVDLVFTPTQDAVYPDGEPQVRIDPGPLGRELEGAVRPGHFSGVLTVVFKLLRLTQPDVAYYGEKDYQQLTLIQAMSRDLDLGIEIVGVPTVREEDGLALSSRNRYLSADERAQALALSAALRAGAAAAAQGASRDEVVRAARGRLTPMRVDYLELRAPDLGHPPVRGDARLLVAARIGTTRLIDNAPIQLAPSGEPAKGV